MRVKALEALSLYYNYGIVAVAAGKEVKGGLALHLLETGAGVEALDEDAKAYGQVSAPAASPSPDAELDIEATAADVLAWVGEDPERAAEALARELAKDKPRSTLVKQLEKLADGE
ncbi:hypothetical protein ACFXB3_07395 [Streptomyces sp. NPDC059447]|uniref:hypothetical protein n=1 Tax=Streptomyces sp. NPDC059447 TaxID=3346834 RepID=UPI0036978C19